jgi:hypothetical protein
MFTYHRSYLHHYPVQLLIQVLLLVPLQRVQDLLCWSCALTQHLSCPLLKHLLLLLLSAALWLHLLDPWL